MPETVETVVYVGVLKSQTSTTTNPSLKGEIMKKAQSTKERVYKGGWPEDELGQMLIDGIPISKILRVLATVMIDNPYWDTYDPRIIDTLDRASKQIARELEDSDD